MITVGLVKQPKPNTLNIRIDRASPLGNPFYMKSEAQRNEVCDKYEKWFASQISNKQSKVYIEIVRLYKLARDGNHLNLQCWCAPKRCHGDTIKRFLDKYL
jgi:hypothetical protein